MTSVAVLSDIHIGLQDKKAWPLALSLLPSLHPDIIVLLGDIVEWESLSRFMKKPEVALRFAKEILLARQELLKLRETCPNAKIFFKNGNHEERLTKYLNTHAPELECLTREGVLSNAPLSVSALLELKKADIQFFPTEQHLKIGRLNYLHGHEIKHSSKNPARTLYSKISANAIAGHHHVFDRFFAVSWDREVRGVYINACLRDLRPDWEALPQWVQGFSYVDYSMSGFFHVDQLLFMNHGKKLYCMLNGQLHSI